MTEELPISHKSASLDIEGPTLSEEGARQIGLHCACLAQDLREREVAWNYFTPRATSDQLQVLGPTTDKKVRAPSFRWCVLGFYLLTSVYSHPHICIGCLWPPRLTRATEARERPYPDASMAEKQAVS